MKVKSGWESKVPRTLFFVLLSVSLILMLPISSVHASGPQLRNNTYCGASTVPVGCASGTVTTGDLLVAAVSWVTTNGVCQNANNLVTLTTDSTTVFTNAITNAMQYSGLTYVCTGQWWAIATSAANGLSFDLQFDPSSTTGNVEIVSYDWAMGNSVPYTTRIFAILSSSGSGSTSSASYDFGSIAIGDWETNGGSTISPDPSFTSGGGISYMNSGYINPSGSGSTTFSATTTSGNLISIAGVIYGPEICCMTVTTYTPPNSTQLQYWYFPILFMGFYDMAFLTVGFLNRVSTKALIYLLLTGLLMGSVFSESVGLSALPLIVITLITYIIYIYRIRTSSR